MHCSPNSAWEGTRKGVLKIACLLSPGQHAAAGGILTCGRNTKKTRFRVTPLTIGAWNVRTLQDRSSANRPERRTALVAREIARYNLHIVALSETRFADEGQLTEKSAGYTFFWSGRKEEERREAGVGFAIKSSLVNKLDSPPKGINDRLMTVRLPLTEKEVCDAHQRLSPNNDKPRRDK